MPVRIQQNTTTTRCLSEKKTYLRPVTLTLFLLDVFLQGMAPMPPPATSPPQQQPYYPPNNGQYYGGWSAPRPTAPPGPHPVPPYPMPYNPHHYPHAPPPAFPQGPPAPPPPQHTPAPLPPTQQLTQTATIRNSVNLKKSSLAVKSIPGDPNRLAISFTFDASQPCVVSTFVAAIEDGTLGNRLTATQQAPSPMIRYPKGLGHKFPDGLGTPAGVAAQHVVDLGQHAANLGALTRATENTFPLVIRLEVITDKGTKEGHTLDELSPGAEQKQWVQSQTTFASLVQEDDETWSVRVIKQKIWVEGTSYELQEIYGLEQAGAGNREGAGTSLSMEDAEERLCVICLVNPRDTTVLPCRHMCLCSDCASELRKQSSKCPICRNNIESLLHIRLNREKEKQREAAAAAEGHGAAESSTPTVAGGAV